MTKPSRYEKLAKGPKRPDLVPPNVSEPKVSYTAADLAAAVQQGREDAIELERTLDLIREADMRGIKMWQEATGRDMEWPDRGKMIFWLLEQLSRACERIATLEADVRPDSAEETS